MKLKLSKIILNHREEFEYCIKLGINPLFWHRTIKLDIGLRLMLQYELFGKSELGKGSTIKANDKYYHYCYNNSLLACENCGTSFYVKENIDTAYSAGYVSHILSRGSRSDLAHDPRNHNMLCRKCHTRWESPQKNGMVIFMDNQIVIQELKFDYQIY